MGLRIFILFSLIVFSLESLSQGLSSIEGTVVDADTNEPIVYASVYLARTTVGTATNLNGAFKLDKIPAGKYDLTISMLGYTTFSKPVVLEATSISNFKVRLKSAAKELETITVKASKIKTRKADFTEFKKFFLGETQNSYHCKILNITDIFVYKQDGKLIALTAKPVEVVNEALGYKIFYDLKEFEVNYLRGQVLTSGIPRFEELVPSSAREKRKWERERDRAYYGSFEHFLRSLVNRNLSNNFFHILNEKGIPISEDSLLVNSALKYKGFLKVTFTNEPPEIQPYKFYIKFQNSSIELNGNPITIFENGNFEDFHNLIVDGYFGWTSHIAELLPYGYQPSKSVNGK